MIKQAVFIHNKIDSSAIRRITNEFGDEVLVIPSYTLPDDCVMNSLFYPADEIAKSYQTLNGTLAPVGHPVTPDGEYISATDANAIDYFHAGITNRNVQRVVDKKYGHRVYIEKHINIKVAEQTERGRAVLAAVEKGEPIHSSTGLLLEIEEKEGVHNGKEYYGIARNITADHDAVLLTEEGAATPDDGVGLFVNSHLFKQVSRNGLQMQVNTVTIKTNQSNRDKEDKIRNAIQALMPDKDYKWLADWGDDYAVIEVEGGTFKVSYSYIDNKVEIIGDPEPVRRVTTWEAIQNAAKKLFNRGDKTTTTNQEGDNMFKEHIEKVLKANSIDFSAMTDEQKLAAYEATFKGNAADTKDETKGEQAKPEGELEVNAAVSELVKAEVAKLLKANADAAEKAERDTLTSEITANSKDFTAEDLAAVPVATLRKMAANSKQKRNSFGVAGGQVNNSNQSSLADMQMPE